MNGLNIIINQIKPSNQKFGIMNLLNLFLIILVLPVMLLIITGVAFMQVFRKKVKYQAHQEWNKVENARTLGLEYRWLKNEEVPDFLADFYQERGIVLFRTSVPIDFF